MAYLQKDILLIGDTFVSNMRGDGEEKEKTKDNTKRFITTTGFDDSFFRVLKENFKQDILADKIQKLLNDSVNPAVLHLSSLAYEMGYEYDTIDCSYKHRSELIELLKTTKYRIVGVSTTFTYDQNYIRRLIELIRKHIPEAKILVGGMHIVKLYKLKTKKQFLEYLKFFDADYYIFNEIGEQPFIDILKYENNCDLDITKSSNIAYRTDNGFVVNPYKENKIDSSVSNWTLKKNTIYAFLRTSISCKFKCKFCDYPSIADGFQSKSIDIIRKELQYIKKSGIKYIRFSDDTFNIPKEHFFSILNELANNDYNFEWVAYIRCQFMDDQTARLMKETGCIGVFLGIESGSNDILLNMNKGSKSEQYLRGISCLNKYGIPTYGTFIVGFPGENNESIKKTIQFIKKSNLTYYRLFLWGYSDLTPIAQEKEKYSIEISSKGWKHSTMTSEEALDKCKYIMKEITSDESIASMHCAIPFDYTFYLNRFEDTKTIFNDCLRRFNNEVVEDF